jgi:hypothetical protein
MSEFNPIASYPIPTSFAEFESALDSGRLFTKMRDGTFWRVRRNGQTQTWVHDPDRREIPIKCGFKLCARIKSYDFQPEHWRIAPL